MYERINHHGVYCLHVAGSNLISLNQSTCAGLKVLDAWVDDSARTASTVVRVWDERVGSGSRVKQHSYDLRQCDSWHVARAAEHSAAAPRASGGAWSHPRDLGYPF